MSKSILGTLIISATALAASANALADDQPRPCSAETLTGLYVFSTTGYNIVGGVAQPKAIVEVIRFNGDETLTVPAATRSINGVIGTSPPGGAGAYTLEPDCKGTLAFTGGPSFDIFASPKGDDLWMIQTNANNVLQGNVTRASR